MKRGHQPILSEVAIRFQSKGLDCKNVRFHNLSSVLICVDRELDIFILSQLKGLKFNSMTPYGLAFTLFRVAACLLFSVGASAFLAYCIARISQGGNYNGDLYFACPAFLFTALLGLLLYVSDGRGAKSADRSSIVCAHPKSYICSFCGKNHTEVRKLIAGPGVNICNKCVVVCKNLLDTESKEDWQI